MKKRKPPKRRSPIAADLGTRKYRQRVVQKKRREPGITLWDYWDRQFPGNMVRVKQ